MRPQLALALLLAAAGCRPAADTNTPDESTAPATDPAARVWDVRVVDTGAGVETSFDAMLDDLAQQQFVLVGETHLDAETHRIEREILEGLIQRRPDDLALSLEMFERDVQPVLDEYLAGKRDEASFLADARPWDNYQTGYRPLIETAKKAGVPVVGSNFPRSLRMKFAMKGGKAIDELSEQERGWLPEKILPAPDEYWERLSKQLRDHGHGGMPKTAEERLYAGQNLWDNSMADGAIAARKKDGIVVHMAGAFHIEYGLGTTAQIRAREPEAELKTVSIVAVDELSKIDPTDVEARADYVVYVVARARGQNDGTFAVNVSDELRYLVAGDSPGATGLPMLIWLAEDGVRTEDELAYWEMALGPNVLVAVVVPPYRQQERDLRVAGRWYWSDTYNGDIGKVVGGTAKIADYATEHFGVDPRRVVVAGAGAGGTAALWTGLYAGDEGDVHPSIVAASPADLTNFAEASLPRDTPALGTVSIIAPEEERHSAEQTLKASGVSSIMRNSGLGPDLLSTWRVTEDRIRAGLGLGAGPSPSGDPITVSIAADTPLARQWARLYARAKPQDDLMFEFGPKAKGKPLAVPAEAFADGQHLPLSPGAFGGTTVLVLPKGVSAAARKAWMKLGEDDVVNKRSRFHHLAVTDRAGLKGVLQGIHEKGRRNVLIVPAEFVAGPETMESLQGAVEGHPDELALHWLPGLGAAYVEVTRAAADTGAKPTGA